MTIHFFLSPALGLGIDQAHPHSAKDSVARIVSRQKLLHMHISSYQRRKCNGFPSVLTQSETGNATFDSSLNFSPVNPPY